MDRQPELARRFFDRFEPVHGITYFAPESRQAMDDLGYRGFWMGYFAARSAPFGQVPAPVVTATFYNFSPTRVAKALPAAWSIAPPADALRTRLASAVAALRRYGVADDDHLRTAAELCAKAATAAPVDGRPLFAANSALPWPGEPIEKLWHAATLLREHRGDGHIAALVTRASADESPTSCTAPPAACPRNSSDAAVTTTTTSGSGAPTAWPRVVC